MTNSHAILPVLAATLMTFVGSTDANSKSGGVAQATVSAPAAADETAIRAALAAYNAALNGGSTAAVLPLYTSDGIFMPPYSQSAIGQAAIRRAYDAVFEELKFNVRFDIAELVLMAPDWAYVRTNSAGTTAHASTKKTTAEANQELFIFKKGDDGMWRIARYSFSPTNPPAQ
jgi:uncharacterized protein (TIGR02246 family)